MPRQTNYTKSAAKKYIKSRITVKGSCWIWPTNTTLAKLMVNGKVRYVRKLARAFWGAPGSAEVTFYGTTCGEARCINPAHMRVKGSATASKPEWDISPEEIERRTAEVREKGFVDYRGSTHAPWSDWDKRVRSGGADVPYTVPFIRLGDYMDRVPVNHKHMDRQLRKIAKATEWVCEPGE